MQVKTSYAKTIDGIQRAINDIFMPKMSYIIYFVSSSYNFEGITKQISQTYQNVPSIGCTTTGETNPIDGYTEGTVTFLAVYDDTAKVDAIMLTNIDKKITLYKRRVTRALNNIEVTATNKNDLDKMYVISLIDSFSQCEERFGVLLNNLFDKLDINLIGGSAGDIQTKICKIGVNGRVEKNACAMLFVKTAKKIRKYKENAYSPININDPHRVTKADYLTRTVYQADNQNILDLYTKSLKLNSKKELTGSIISDHPFGRVISGDTLIASPSTINKDNSISFYTKVLTGSQFYFMKLDSLVESNKRTYDDITKDGTPELILGFNCILRYLKYKELHLQKQLYQNLTKGTQMFAATTLGEIYGKSHVNQTLTLLTIS